LVEFLEKLIVRATTALEFCVWQDGSIPPIGDSQVYPLKIASRNQPRCFCESGFAVIKSKDLYLSVQCGGRTEIHKQVDDSSVTLRFNHHDILIDGGAYLYDQTDPYRRCVESSLGHSGLFLKQFDGLLRREFVHKFGPISGKIDCFEECRDGVRLRCLYSVGGGKAVFVRDLFVCWPDEVAIVDSVQFGPAADGSGVVQRFLFGAGLVGRFDGADKLVLSSDACSCALFQLRDCAADLYRGQNSPITRGWFSKKYKEIEPTCGVDFVLQNPKTTRFSTIIKLTACENLTHCSAAVRKFAG
jgi:hypothetical protein